MKKNNKRPPEIKDIWDRVTACKDENELREVWDLIDDLASANLITASQYILLTNRCDDVLSYIALQDERA